MRDTKIVQKFLNRPDIRAGRKPRFEEFADYEQEKQHLLRKCQSPEEYETRCKELAKIWGI